jgi:hypothetical protein
MLLLTPAVNTCLHRPKRRKRSSSKKQQATSETQDTNDPEATAETVDTSQCCRMQDSQQTGVCRCGMVQASMNSFLLLLIAPGHLPLRQSYSLYMLQLEHTLGKGSCIPCDCHSSCKQSTDASKWQHLVWLLNCKQRTDASNGRT